MDGISRLVGGVAAVLTLALPATALAGTPVEPGAPPECFHYDGGAFTPWTSSADDPISAHGVAQVPMSCFDERGPSPMPTIQVTDPGELGELVRDDGGHFTYEPTGPVPAKGTLDSITFRVSRGDDPSNVSGDYTVWVLLGQDQNHAPTCAAQEPYESAERGAGVLWLAFCRDGDRDDVTVSVKPGAGPQHGELVVDGGTGGGAFVGHRRWAGTTAADSFTVVVTDAYGKRGELTLTAPEGPAPVGNPPAPVPPVAPPGWTGTIVAPPIAELLRAPAASRRVVARVLRTGTVPGPTLTPDADGRATVTAKLGTRTVGTSRVPLRAGRKAKLDVRLSKAGRRALKRVRRRAVTVALGVSVKDVTGRVRKTSYRVRLRR